MRANTFYNIFKRYKNLLTFIYYKVMVIMSRSLRNTVMKKTIAPVINMYQF